MTKLKALVAAVLLVAGLAACTSDSDADVVSENLSTAADQFEIQRKITFYNGITGDVLLEIEGLCSLGNHDTRQRLSVTCKTGERDYKKHFLGLSDNVTFVVEQVDGANVSAYHYRVIWKPQAVIPDVDLRGSTSDGPQSQ